MPTPTYIPLANLTLGSSASSVSFSSIPASFRDLVVVATHASTAGNYDTSLRFNGDSGSNYFNVYALGAGSGSPSSGTQTLTFADCGYSGSSGVLLNRIINIMDYSATDKHKTLISRGSGPAVGEQVIMYANRWANTAAITSVVVFRGGGGNYNAGATFALYGIAS